MDLDQVKCVNGQYLLSTRDSTDNIFSPSSLKGMRKQLVVKQHNYNRYYVSSDQQQHFRTWNFGSCG